MRASSPPSRRGCILILYAPAAEIKDYIRLFGEAAANAVHKAGFDGVEVHGATGYLVDQFLQDVSNTRTDAYGGSIENRARFALEVVDAVAAAVGETKAAIRLSPWSMYQDMRMEDPIPQFSYVVEQLKARHPDLAYIHVVASTAMFNKGPEDPSVRCLPSSHVRLRAHHWCICSKSSSPTKSGPPDP